MNDECCPRFNPEPWDEKKVTYANRPALGRELARLGAVSENEVVERPGNICIDKQFIFI